MDAPLDLLAVGPHRDDVELLCGGTIARHVALGRRVGILDLTAGEMGTRGSAALRAEEAERAAQVLGVAVRRNLGLPDAAIENTPATRTQLARVLREHKGNVSAAAKALGVSRNTIYRKKDQLPPDVWG